MKKKNEAVNDFDFDFYNLGSVLDLPDIKVVAPLVPLEQLDLFPERTRLHKVVQMKSQFTVTAGSESGVEVESHRKVWEYTSEHLKKDQFPPADELTIFCKMEKEPSEYASSLRGFNEINWVNLEWKWIG
jgi:hypothetical protein